VSQSHASRLAIPFRAVEPTQPGEAGRAEQGRASGALADLADQALKPPREGAALVSFAFLVRRAVGEVEFVGAQVRHDDACRGRAGDL